MPEPLSPAVRAELDQTAEWWDRRYRALERKRIPRDEASHHEHRIQEDRTYFSTTVRRTCIDCGIEIDPYEEGTHG